MEKIYTDPASPFGSPLLRQSLKDSGKSRADLWAFAGIVAVEFGMEMNNIACDDRKDARVIQPCCMHLEGEDGCKIRPDRSFIFETGRADCVEHDAIDTYKATKEESHPTPVGNGKDTVDFFKKTYNTGSSIKRISL